MVQLSLKQRMMVWAAVILVFGLVLVWYQLASENSRLQQQVAQQQVVANQISLLTQQLAALPAKPEHRISASQHWQQILKPYSSVSSNLNPAEQKAELHAEKIEFTKASRLLLALKGAGFMPSSLTIKAHQESGYVSLAYRSSLNRVSL